MNARLTLRLAALSGLCGLAYEVVYARLLASYLGELFFVAAGVLTAFLLGLGLGALFAHKLEGRLWLVEGLVGVYSLGVVALTKLVPFEALVRALPGWSESPAGALACVVAALLLPAALAGAAVPLFARAAADFDEVYRRYNLGAAACVLALDLLLIGLLGLSGTLLALAATNLFIAAALKLRDLEPPPAAEPPGRLALAPAAALVVASAGSALYQLSALKLSSTIFGPFHENFAVVLACALVGLALGASLHRRFRPELGALLGYGAALTLISALLLIPLVRLWGYADPLMYSALRRLVGKLLFAALIFGPPFVVFGATVPAVVDDHPRAAGRALGLSSLGNAAGYLTSAVLIFPRATFLGVALIAAGSLGLGALLVARARALLAIGLCAVLALPLALTWNESIFDLPYTSLRTDEGLVQALVQLEDARRVRRFDSQLSLVRARSGALTYVMNGYMSLIVDSRGRANPFEMLVGAVPASYPPARERALVLGVGTGITAGAASQLFDEVTAVDVDPAVMAALPEFRALNFGLDENPRVDVRLDDALRALADEGPAYDAIINTVTSPLYFSSSKLYTVELLRLAKSRLKPGGVYSTWLDDRITREGAAITFATALEVFEACHVVALRAGYANLVCGDGPLRPRYVQPTPALAEAFAAWGFRDLPTLIDQLSLPGDGLAAAAEGAALNTLDHPRLERRMARVALLPRRSFKLDEVVALDLERSVYRDAPLTPDEVRARCAAARRLFGHDMPGCAAALARLPSGERSR